jgi:hypothetical protein
MLDLKIKRARITFFFFLSFLQLKIYELFISGIFLWAYNKLYMVKGLNFYPEIPSCMLEAALTQFRRSSSILTAT